MQNNFRKEETLWILFSDEKLFDINILYNLQNKRIWSINHVGADGKGGAMQKKHRKKDCFVCLRIMETI